MTKQTPTRDEIPAALSDAKNTEWSKVKLGTPLTASVVEMLASSYGVKYYAKNTKERNMAELLDLDQQNMERIGMHRLPPNVIDAINETLRLVSVDESRQNKVTPIDEQQQQKVVDKAFDVQTKVPGWFWLGNKECAVMPFDENKRFLIHQLDGVDGFFAYTQCPVGDASLRSCAIPLTLSAVSKLLNVNVINDNVVLTKSSFLRLVKGLNLTTSGIDNHMPSAMFLRFIEIGKPFKDIDVVYIERTETDLQPFDSGEIIMKNNSLRRAGEAFMFNIIFGISDSPSSFKIKTAAQRVTKVLIDPGTASIRKLLDLADKSYQSIIKNQAERTFLPTKTILDDAQFIEGMNDVRQRVIYNRTVLQQLIDSSPMSEEDRSTLQINIQMLQNMTLADFLIRLSTESAGSPWRPSK